MKKLLSLLTALAFVTIANAQNWKLDNAHSKIHFSAKYLLISDVTGEFKKFEGVINSERPDWSDLKADVTIDVSSINTENGMRDKHLVSDDFFNAEKYPTMTFKATGMKKLDGKKYVMSGDLTIRDVTKKVDLPVVYNGTVTDPWGNTKAGFKATGTLNRQDYNLKYANKAAAGEAVVSDDIDFTIDVVLIKQ
ncbi:MAG: polyisoprenoid-binding protein [Bacteroidetes bacterium]|nr:MAG: polyisoprenoid-binding protein [Bacteroidota bacterium]REK35243.1 MAG: polyisoprenoid-binding protein [Bacteroidota bacterium]REK48320.1 MAG: polyisoprenoid-binding protein [Bacteroidota bacterium]